MNFPQFTITWVTLQYFFFSKLFNEAVQVEHFLSTKQKHISIKSSILLGLYFIYSIYFTLVLWKIIPNYVRIYDFATYYKKN